MIRAPEIRFIPLACPSCRRDLPALDDDVAFACPPCRIGLELVGEALRDRPLRVVPRASSHGFHLPFWRLGRTVCVPAFNTREVLSLARRFTGRELDEEHGELGALVGGTMSSEEAWRAARFAGLAPPDPGPREVALLAVPFLDEGNRLLDTATGAILYKETIDRCEELVRAAQP